MNTDICMLIHPHPHPHLHPHPHPHPHTKVFAMLVTAEHQAAKGMTPASLLRMASASAEDLASYLDDAQVTCRCI